jgi:hypothetical protein
MNEQLRATKSLGYLENVSRNWNSAAGSKAQPKLHILRKSTDRRLPATDAVRFHSKSVAFTRSLEITAMRAGWYS